MFKSYSGSNKVIGDDDSIFFTNSYHYKFYSKVQSDTYMLPAV
jgi:ribosomal protein L27